MKAAVRIVSLAIPIALGLSLAGCGKQAAGPAPSAKAPGGQPYVIGAIFAVTGDASSLGVPERNTAVPLEKMIDAEGGINGRPPRIVVEGSKSQPAEALSAAKRRDVAGGAADRA